MVRIHPDPPDSSLFNNMGWKVKLFSPARGAKCCVLKRRGLTGLCIASCVFDRSDPVGMHKLKRESYLWRCDASSDFGSACLREGGSKVIGSSE
jgi:hypothetical protein